MAGIGGFVGLANVYPGMVQGEQQAAQQDLNRLRVLSQIARAQQAQALQPYREARMRQLLAGGGRRGGDTSLSLPAPDPYATSQQSGPTVQSGSPPPLPSQAGGSPVPPQYGADMAAGSPQFRTPQPWPTQPGAPVPPSYAGLQGAGLPSLLSGSPVRLAGLPPSPDSAGSPPGFPSPLDAGIGRPPSAPAAPGLPPGSGASAAPPPAPSAPQTPAGGGTNIQAKISELESKIDASNRRIDKGGLTKRQEAEERRRIAGYNTEINNFRKDLKAEQTAATGASRASDVEANVQGVLKGIIPPNTRFFRDTPAVMAGIARAGGDLTSLQRDWYRAQREMATLQGPRMVQLAAAYKNFPGAVDEVKRLANQMQLSGYPLYNHYKLMADQKINANSPQGQLTTQYIAAITMLREELLPIVMGGAYAPTESVWKQVNTQLRADMGNKQLLASLDELEKFANIRYRSIPGMETVGPGAPNRFIPGSEAPAAPTQPATAAPALEQPPMPGARKAPDGNWYIQQGDKYYKVTQ